MPARLLLLLCCSLLVCACSPALEIRRLSPPKAVLGTARTVHVQVIPGPFDVVEGQPERVSEMMLRRISERLSAVGYTVCPQLPCDGALEVDLAPPTPSAQSNTMPHLPTMDMMEAAFGAVRKQAATSAPAPGSPAVTPQANVHLRVRITLTQADGKIGYLRSLTEDLTAAKPMGDLTKDAVDAVVKTFGDELSRQEPEVVVRLEVGGPLNHGVELLHAGDWAGAVGYFTELTRAQPELDGAWYDLGFALEAQRAWGPALEAYRAAAQRARKPHYTRAVAIAQTVLSNGESLGERRKPTGP
jgi:hypothetical protein